MSVMSDMIRAQFKEGDDVRDAGLTTPEGIKRFDDIAYGPDADWQLLGAPDEYYFVAGRTPEGKFYLYRDCLLLLVYSRNHSCGICPRSRGDNDHISDIHVHNDLRRFRSDSKFFLETLCQIPQLQKAFFIDRADDLFDGRICHIHTSC